jgi:filamentous hemagglutinin family protein
MNRHGSMNRVYRLIWSTVRNVWIPVAEKTRGRGKRASRTLVAATLLLGAAYAQAGGPTGGQVTAGTGSIAQAGNITTITQDSSKLSLSWTSFNIAPQETVDFLQPSASAVAINRIFGANGTQILGHLNANGQVYLINPNGILFGPGAEVNVGGLVATTLNLDDTSLAATSRSFSGNSADSVINEGTINAAPGGYVVLLGNLVSNQGVISAQLGSVALAAGSAATLTFSNNSLVHLQVDQNLWRSLAENGGVIRADGGQVLMTAGAKDALVASVVNNTGVIEARTVDAHEGTITLLGGMAAGAVEVAGTLDASAPNGGNGGFIETSAAHVEVADDAKVTTAAASGLYGSWLIDPVDFNVAASGGNITGAALSTDLGTTNVSLQSSNGTTGVSGNLNVNDTVSWGANTLLTLTAANNVNINANITATGNTAGLIINPNTTNGAETATGTGIYTLLGGASITLSGTTPSLSIAGISYTVINTLGAAGSMTGTDLQGINGALSGHYALGSNLDASANLANWNGGAGFTPIGSLTAPFTGIFDGLGHTISTLTIDQPISYVGLFGYVGAAGVIGNVGLLGGSVAGGSYYVGGLVGRNFGSVVNSYMTGNVTGSLNSGGGLVGSNNGMISGSHATGTVSAPDNTGGLVGANNGTITDSYATGAVSGAFDVGGLVGYSPGNGIDVYATGAVTGTANIGGLVGLSRGTFSDSYATGSAHGSGASIGGLVGNNYGAVDESYATGAVSGASGRGGLVGSNSGTVTYSYWDTTTSGQTTSAGGGTPLTTLQMQTATNFSYFNFTTNAGAGGNSWVMVDADGTLNNAGGAGGATFPMLTSEYSTIVTNAHQLQLMAMNLAASYTLGQNIDASATALAASSGSSDIWSTSGGFVPIGGNGANFTGNFDGMGYTISNLTINLPQSVYVGLFGFIASGSVVQNVTLLGGSVTGGGNTGELAGASYGSISNSYATGNVNGSGGGQIGGLVGINNGAITNSYATGSVTGGENVGGLVGSNYGSITSSHATGSVTGTGGGIGGLLGNNYGGPISNSYATGNVTGSNYVGGLVGQGGGTISNSYAIGSVIGSGYDVGGLAGFYYGAITNSHATGSVSGVNNVGGLVGLNTGPISGSYGAGRVIGTANDVGGLVGFNYGVPITGSHATGNVSGTGADVGGLVGRNANVGPISNSYATGNVTGSSYAVGGLVGMNYGAITSSYAKGNVSGSSYVGGLVGTNYTTITSSYATGSVGAGAGNNVGGLVGRDSGAIYSSYATGAVSGGSYVGGLIGQAGTEGPLLINASYATGTVNGANDVGGLVGLSAAAISNSYATGRVTGSGYDIGGLVGLSNGGGTIGYSYATGTISGTGAIGGLVGYNDNGSTVSNSFATGIVVGTVDAGGLVGYNNSGAVSSSYATGNVGGTEYIGGLVGYNNYGSSVSNSYATGNVSGTQGIGGLVGYNNFGTLTNTYATGNVTGSTGLGGLVGYNNYGTVANSYAAGSVQVNGVSGGFIGSNYGSNVTNSFWNSDINANGIGAGATSGCDWPHHRRHDDDVELQRRRLEHRGHRRQRPHLAHLPRRDCAAAAVLHDAIDCHGGQRDQNLHRRSGHRADRCQLLGGRSGQFRAYLQRRQPVQRCGQCRQLRAGPVLGSTGV